MRDSADDAATTDGTDGHRDAASGAHWLGDDALDRRLPAALRTALGRFLGRDSVDTLAAWSEAVRARTGGGPMDLQDLCHADAATEHWGDLDGERYHFRCFYDAVILATLAAGPVEIHTKSPGGSAIHARADGDGSLSVTPETAVFSFGIASDAGEGVDGNPTLSDSYAAICPYVRAFPDRDAYEAWARDVPAATVAAPLAGATAVARTLTAGETDE